MRTARPVRPLFTLLAVPALAGWTAACPGGTPAAAAPCPPVEGELAPGARADVLEGEFRLTLVATRGPAAGASTTGTLRLEAFGGRPGPVPAQPGVRVPLFGGTDVDLAAVGAIAPGAIGEADPARPGVLVLEWPRPGAPAGTNEVTLRLGADANRGGELRFDGAYMALSVAALSPGRFAGSWRSGGGDHQAGGHFCAERIER